MIKEAKQIATDYQFTPEQFDILKKFGAKSSVNGRELYISPKIYDDLEKHASSSEFKQEFYKTVKNIGGEQIVSQLIGAIKKSLSSGNTVNIKGTTYYVLKGHLTKSGNFNFPNPSRTQMKENKSNIDKANIKAEERVETVFNELVKTFPDKFESPLDKSKLRFAISTAFVKLTHFDVPENLVKESVFSSNYVSNVRPDGKYNEDIEATIYKDGNGGYNISLNTYSASGNGPMATRTLRTSTNAIPLDQFTATFIKNKAINIPDDDIERFLTKIRDRIQEKEIESQDVNENRQPLRERIKSIIRRKLSER
jgi:hypothetical protein